MNVHNFVFASIYSEFKLELYMYVSLCVCARSCIERERYRGNSQMWGEEKAILETMF